MTTDAETGNPRSPIAIAKTETANANRNAQNNNIPLDQTNDFDINVATQNFSIVQSTENPYYADFDDIQV